MKKRTIQRKQQLLWFTVVLTAIPIPIVSIGIWRILHDYVFVGTEYTILSYVIAGAVAAVMSYMLLKLVMTRPPK